MKITNKLLFVIICLLALQCLLTSITNYNLTRVEERIHGPDKKP